MDTNILLDVLIPGAPFAGESERKLVQATQAGALVICETVYAELAANFRDGAALEQFLADTAIRLDRSSSASLHAAGAAWRKYARTRPAHMVCPQCRSAQSPACSNCGLALRPRLHVIADFLIGAHALHQAGRLITLDRGYYAAHFSGLALE